MPLRNRKDAPLSAGPSVDPVLPGDPALPGEPPLTVDQPATAGSAQCLNGADTGCCCRRRERNAPNPALGGRRRQRRVSPRARRCKSLACRTIRVRSGWRRRMGDEIERALDRTEDRPGEALFTVPMPAQGWSVGGVYTITFDNLDEGSGV